MIPRTTDTPNLIVQDKDWRTVHRVVMPADGDTDTLPLYVDFNAAQRVVPDDSNSKRGASVTSIAMSTAAQRTDYIEGRRSIHVPAFRRVSFGTYFNAFPASYWRAHTDIKTVRLTVVADGDASVVVFRSTARGTANRVESLKISSTEPATIDLPLTNFGDGGWYWFDLVAGAETVRMLAAEWSVEQPEGFIPGRATIAVTTFNRPEYCVKHLTTFAEDQDVLNAIDVLLITDQGTSLVKDQPGYTEAAAKLGEKFRLVEQGNIGGSGGFARGMFEASTNTDSKYVLLLDDDVLIETEGILRAINFADFCRTPTIVGGHMFNLYERSVMHTFGEEVDLYKFFWGPVETTKEAHDFSASNLRTTPWMHRRVDVDFNGWWMCLIPTEIIKQIGLALPVFIKWDDAEFGLRAKKHGFKTVSLPGAAVWHMPWTEKDDTIDWQAYFHQRNRWLAAMLYSPYERAGSLPRLSFMVDVKHLLSMQYSAVDLRLNALQDLLEGPDHLHRSIRTKMADIRARRAGFADAQVSKEISEFPAAKALKPPKRGKKPKAPNNIVAGLKIAAVGAARQFTARKESTATNPEALVPAMDARWWRLSQLDSALVTSADGSGASWYKRDPEQFRTMLARSLDLHRKLLTNWDRLSREYADSLAEFTSPEAWQETFHAVSKDVSEPKKK